MHNAPPVLVDLLVCSLSQVVYLVSVDLVLVPGLQVQVQVDENVVVVAELVVAAGFADPPGLWSKCGCTQSNLVGVLGFQIATQRCLLV